MQLSLAQARTYIRLGQEIGRGGEGSVFAVDGRHDLVAKIYTTPPDQRKIQKLSAMAGVANPALLRIAAWPTDLLKDANGTVRGFVMSRITARRDIHELYSPKSRSEGFPEADFRFLLHAGTNIARAFAVIHEHGQVLGDINHGNLLVAPDATVILIDCDSFQIRTGAHMFTCDVGVPLFTAPELQGRAFRGLLRTSNHDCFGLAVLLFHLLFMGRHPFAGRYSGPGDMPIEKAIAEYRFAYGPDRAANGMECPPGTITLETMGPAVAANFVRAFGPTGSNGARPDSKSWISVLENLKASLRVCSSASWHQYPGTLQSCPWCVIETQTPVRLFGQRITAGGPTGTIDIGQLWQAITAVPDLGPDPALPSERPWKLPADIDLPSATLRGMRKILSIGLVCVGLVACNVLARHGGLLQALIAYWLAYTVWPHISPQQRSAAEHEHSAAMAEWQNALGRWQHEASRNAFLERKKSLEKARTELVDLPNERRRLLAKLEAQRESQQRQRYLDRFRIDRAGIRGIGAARTAMLESYGIETAADVDYHKIIHIPGFGEALTTELIEWRRRHERNFRFNPNEPVDPRDIDALNRELEAHRHSLLTTLRQGPDTLRKLSQEISAARSRLMPAMEKAWNSYKIAETRRNAL
ncbi:MAG: helix-hairpin-helix domain-containing protein [Nitrospiraceae bacterium]